MSPAPTLRVAFRSVVLLAALAATACSRRALGEVFFLGDDFHLREDLAYGPDPRQVLDVYTPSVPEGAARPIVVFLYGGRWQEGSKREYRLLGDQLVRRGFIAVVPDYRLHPAVDFPAWVEDGAAAVAWAHDHGGDLGGDPTRMFVFGHSAGAHTAALLDLDERWLAEAGVPAGVVRGVAALSGPVDTVWTDPDIRRLMGPEAGWPETYPRTHVDGTEPPLLLLHGADDETVAPRDSERLAARIEAAGGCAAVRIYPDTDHIGIIVAASVPKLKDAAVLDDLAAFFGDPGGICR